MKRLGTENLSFGRSYENFEVSPAKPIWRSFAQKWPKSAYIKACIKRNLNNTMQNLTLLQAFWYTILGERTQRHLSPIVSFSPQYNKEANRYQTYELNVLQNLICALICT